MLRILEKDGKKYVLLTELYGKLKLQKAIYSKFYKDKLINSEYATEGVEYLYLGIKTTDKGGRPKPDYLLSLSFAKSIIVQSKRKAGKKYHSWLVEVEKKVASNELLLSEEQVKHLVKLKLLFKHLCYDKEKIAVVDDKKNPYAEYSMWRSRLLNISPSVFNESIKQYCIDDLKNMKGRNKQEKLLILDKYDSIREAVLSFVEHKGEYDSVCLISIINRMASTEGTELFRAGGEDLVRRKEEPPVMLPSKRKSKLEQELVKPTNPKLSWDYPHSLSKPKPKSK